MANKKPKVIFLSLPMSGRSEEDIRKQIAEMEEKARNINQFYEGCINNLDCDIPEALLREASHGQLLYLGTAIKLLAFADAIMMGEGWEFANGCVTEYQVALRYGIPVYDENGNRMGAMALIPTVVELEEMKEGNE